VASMAQRICSAFTAYPAPACRLAAHRLPPPGYFAALRLLPDLAVISDEVAFAALALIDMTMRTSLQRSQRHREAARRLLEALYDREHPWDPSGSLESLSGVSRGNRYQTYVAVAGRRFIVVREPRCSVCRSPWQRDIEKAVVFADRALTWRAVPCLPRSDRPRARDFGWTAISRRFREARLSPDAIRRHVGQHAPILEVQDWLDYARRRRISGR
jgi:hypothetical protein